MNAIIVLAVTGILSMYAGIFDQKRFGLPIAALGCLLASVIILGNYIGDYSALMNNMLLFDNFSLGFSAVMIIVSIGVLIMSKFYYSSEIEHLTDIYALFIFSLIGGIIMVSYQNLVMLFLGTEILSIPLYILASSNRRNLASNEAGLKYYLTGSFASCFLLLGITLIYGAVGSLDINIIAQYISLNNNTLSGLFITGSVLVLGAFIFKVSAVPFHFWAPDVYQGSPTILTVFLVTVVKIAAFGALIRFISFTIFSHIEIWQKLLYIISIITMIGGNGIAIYQHNLKRLLAYAGIANAGFLLMAVITPMQNTNAYILYYFAGYSVASIMGFSIYSVIKNQTGIDSIDGLKGLITNNKLLTISLTIVSLSMSGIPPLAGFFGKYLIFSNVIQSDEIFLFTIAILTSIIGAYNYFRVMTFAIQTSDVPIQKVYIDPLYRVLLIWGIILIVGIGILPDQIINFLN
ncbi:MAG: NADH-quinone oxidoreductase subunit N [Saprospiraceae bacterium]|nr:NADH-quinone oxidoreductase subunit N [Saprospiraceae bacterium]